MSSSAPTADPERQPLLPDRAATDADAAEAPAPPPRPWWKRKRSILKGCGILFLIDFCVSGIVVLYLLLTRGHHDAVLRYPGETVTWTPCGELEAGLPLECSTIEVPMDHFNASRSGNHTFSVPLVRLRGGDNATHNVLLNPGGPGGSGIDFVKRKGAQLRTALGDDFHLVSFDPRGIGASRPQAVCFPDAKTRRTHQPRLDAVDEHDITHWNEIGAWTHACQDHLGAHAAFVNTPQTAADMNSILDALGQDGLYYMGYSYGTALGATYATLFPERAERVMIDGVLDNVIWYTERMEERFYKDDDAAFAGLFDACAKEGDGCKLSVFGNTGKDIQRNVTDFLTQLRDDGPMPVYINSTTFGTVSYKSLYGGIFMALYSPPAWYALADTLAQLLSGNATAALLAYPDGAEARADGEDLMDEHNLFVMANDRPAGPSAWPSSPRKVYDIAAASQKYMPWMMGTVGNTLFRAQWPVPKSHAFTPGRGGVQTKHPLLVMSTTYDPVCPLVSAQRAREMFTGARLVEVRGIGHCALSQPSSCAAKALRAFIVNGTLPEEEHTLCERDEGERYFVDPKEKERKKEDGVKALGVSEEEERMAAWRDLADAISEPRFASYRF